MFDNTRKVTSVPMTPIQGIGDVVSGPIRVVSEGVNYEKSPDTNLHNENAIYINNHDHDIIDDDTVLDFACTAQKCELKIAMNSEVGTDLYNNGYFQLFFDRASQKWDMKAYRKSGWDDVVEWKFCSPNDSLAHVVSILKFLAIDGEKEMTSADQSIADFATVNSTLKQLAASIERTTQQTVATAAIYTKSEDCHAAPLSATDVDPVDRTVMID